MEIPQFVLIRNRISGINPQSASKIKGSVPCKLFGLGRGYKDSAKPALKLKSGSKPQRPTLEPAELGTTSIKIR